VDTQLKAYISNDDVGRSQLATDNITSKNNQLMRQNTVTSYVPTLRLLFACFNARSWGHALMRSNHFVRFIWRATAAA